MISKYKSKSEFTRNVLTLVTGTTLAQAIPFALSPILTRIYTPEDYGVFALFVSLTSIISVFSSGRYELAIMLPKKDYDAIHLIALTWIITVIISFITLLIVFVFNTEISNLLGNSEISNWLYFVPISIFITGMFKGINYWFNRKKQYKNLAINRIIQSGSNSSLNVGFGVGGLGAGGLVFSSIMGQILSALYLLNIMRVKFKIRPDLISRIKILALARKYKKFPQYDIMATFANVSSHQITNVLFNTLLSSTVAGYYYFTQRIMGIPISFLSAAVSDVFREQASRDYQKYGNAKVIYLSTFKKLFFLSLIPSVLIYFFAVDVFTFVFGENWRISGVYAQILVPMFFLRFISSPLTFMLYIGEKQNLNLIVNLLFLSLTILSFYVSNSPLQTVKLLSLSGVIVYFIYLFLSAKIAKVF